MSVRNRPRNTVAKEDLTEEISLWKEIVGNIRKCQSINEVYEDLASKIPEAESAVPDDDPTAALAALEVLSNLERECLKQSEAELKILNEEPDDLLKNLEALISVRTAMEADTPQPRDRHAGKDAPSVKPGRNVKRKHDAVANDTSAESPNSTPAPEPVVSIPAPSKAMAAAAGPIPKKIGRSSSGSAAAGTTRAESVVEADQVVKSVASNASIVTSAASASAKFAIGTEVFFRHRQRSANVEGEGIICTVTNVFEPSGPQKLRKFEIQDTEADDNGNVPAPVKVVASDLVAIAKDSTGLPTIPKGKQVIARYPSTNTFYKADVVRTVGKACKLRFEGEEDEKMETEVERRYVFDMK